MAFQLLSGPMTLFGPADCLLGFFSLFKVLRLPALEAGTLLPDNRQGAGVHCLL